MTELLDYNIEVLHRIDHLLGQLSNAQHSAPSALLFGSTMGDHFRHILEFYQCLLSNVEVGEFSYDKRQRNHLIATDVGTARDVLRNALAQLMYLDSTAHQDVELVMQSELPGYTNLFAHRTTLSRELAYLADHGVHHLALIRISLEQEHPHILLDANLGVAASTVNYRRQ